MSPGKACDLELSPGRYCDRQPVTHFALAAALPATWNDRDGSPAALAAFCSREHADAEPRPALADAKRSYALVADMCGDQRALDIWEQLVRTYPEPVEVSATT